MIDLMRRHHGRDEGEKPIIRLATVPSNCKSTPSPKRRQHSKSLIIYQLFNNRFHPNIKLGKVYQISYAFSPPID